MKSRRVGVLRGVLFLTILVVVGCAKPQSAPDNSSSASRNPSARPAIVFMTDFGTANDAVAICKAVMIGIAPDARIMDITHQVTPFSIEEGARFLAGVSPYYPAGTVFVAVIDPGVGTTRRAVVVKTKKSQYFVLPDNGLISPVVDRDGLDSAREITNTSWMIGENVSSTFHGRDISLLALTWPRVGISPWSAQWSATDPPHFQVFQFHHKGIDGDLIGLDDPFGSIITDIPADQFKVLGYAIGDRVPCSSTRSLHSPLRQNLYGCAGG